ncbi:MAG: DUF2313 domain-containing protein [Lachnospiraceae bacterium]|nr:DUF2313 domain-containing protein [Lachnospiraceae bacterium]
MIREVELVSYLPPFLKEYEEIHAALTPEDSEFRILWKAADKILANEFIATADESGIERFEKILGIFPSDSDTLESRRARVQSNWFITLPYTMRMLVEKIAVLCGDSDFKITGDLKKGYTIQIYTELTLFGQAEELRRILDEMMPCNMEVLFENEVKFLPEGRVFCAGGIVCTDVIEIKN